MKGIMNVMRTAPAVQRQEKELQIWQLLVLRFSILCVFVSLNFIVYSSVQQIVGFPQFEKYRHIKFMLSRQMGHKELEWVWVPSS